MKYRALALCMVFAMMLGFTPAQVFAEAPPDAASLNIGTHHIQIVDSGAVFYDTDPASPVSTQHTAAGFVITGVQNGHKLTIQNASVPVWINTDIDMFQGGQTGVITSSSYFTVNDGKKLKAASITHVPQGSGNPVTLYPVTLTFGGMAAGQSYSVLVNGIAPAQQRTVDSEGGIDFWLENGTYTFVIPNGGVNYQFKATVNNAAVQAVLQYSGGQGTGADPYRIRTAGDLANIRMGDTGADVHYRLETNGLTVTAPLGSQSSPFKGVFNGNGNSIALSIGAGHDYAGLFAAIAGGGQVTNLSLSGSLAANGGYAGSLAGANDGIIENIASAVQVSGAQNVGGIAASNGGTIRNSYVTGAVSGAQSAGGIAGGNGGTIQNSYATGTVSGAQSAGGIAGSNGGTIQNSYATGTVSGVQSAGGIAGTNSATIRNSYATGAVGGAHNAGGIAGTSGGTINNSMALNPSVTGSSLAGRVVSSASGTLSGNYAAQATRVNNQIVSQNIGTGSINGATLTNAQLASASTYASCFGSVWTLTNGRLPVLAGISGQSGTIPSHLVYTPSGGSGGGGGGGNNEPPYSETFWKEMLTRIKKAESGDTIKFGTSRLENMPVSILKELKGKNVTLEITHDGEKIIINGKRMYSIPGNRVFYTFDALAELYEEQPEASSKPSSSSRPAASSSEASSQWTPTYPQYPTTTTPSSSSSSSSSVSEPESSEPEDEEIEAEEESRPEELETDAEPEKPARSKVPLVIAGVVVAAALAGGGVFYYYYRRRSESYYDFDDDEK